MIRKGPLAVWTLLWGILGYIQTSRDDGIAACNDDHLLLLLLLQKENSTDSVAAQALWELGDLHLLGTERH